MTERLGTNVEGKQTSTRLHREVTVFVSWSLLLSSFRGEETAGGPHDWHTNVDRLVSVNFEGRLENALFCLREVPAVSESLAIEHGLPATAAWGSLEELGFTKLEIAQVVDTSEKTIQRKEKKAERLGVAEGDRTMRLLRIVVEAVDAIGDREKALRWLRKPNRALGGKKPLDAIATERGVAMVRQSLAAIAYGGVA